MEVVNEVKARIEGRTRKNGYIMKEEDKAVEWNETKKKEKERERKKKKNKETKREEKKERKYRDGTSEQRQFSHPIPTGRRLPRWATKGSRCEGSIQKRFMRRRKKRKQKGMSSKRSNMVITK